MSQKMATDDLTNDYDYDSVLIGDEDEIHSVQYPQPIKYERYDSTSFIKTQKQVRSDSKTQSSLKSSNKHDSKSLIKNKNYGYLKPKNRSGTGCKSSNRISGRKTSVQHPIALSNNAYNDHSKYTSRVPQTQCSTKKRVFCRDDTKQFKEDRKEEKFLKSKRSCHRPLNFRSIDRLNQSSNNTSSIRNRYKTDVNTSMSSTKAAKNTLAKSERLRKHHISYICRRDPRKYRIIAFAQVVAAKKIQSHFRNFIHHRVKREAAAFDKEVENFKVQHAGRVVGRHLTTYAHKQRTLKELLEFHRDNNLSKILMIQSRFRSRGEKHPRMNVPRFKQLFSAYLAGWRVRRILSYIKSHPEMREVIDYIRLRHDLASENTNDLFYKKILELYPSKIMIFSQKYNDLYENAVWIKKPLEIHAPRKSKSVTKGRKYSTSINRYKAKSKIPNRNMKKFKYNNADLADIYQPEETSMAIVRSGLSSRKKSEASGRVKTIRLEDETVLCSEDTKTRQADILQSLQKRRELRRPNSTLSNYQSVNCSTARNHQREKSQNLVGGTSRSKLQTINEFDRSGMTKNDSLRTSFNQVQLGGLSLLRTRSHGLQNVRNSCDSRDFKCLNSSIVNFNEIRNRNKISRQKHDVCDLSDIRFETIDEIEPENYGNYLSQTMMNTFGCNSRENLVRQSLNDTAPLSIRDNNVSLHDTQSMLANDTPKKLKQDKFEALGLASKLIMNILEATEADETLQLSILDECKFLIESRGKKTKKLIRPNTGNIKLRQAVKKYSNKENSSMEYEIALTNIQDIFKQCSAS